MTGRQRDYRVFYEALTASLRGREQTARVLRWLNRLLTILIYGSYAAILAGMSAAGWKSGGAAGAVRCAAPYVLVPGISFVLVSVVRDRIDEKRPYETWDIQPLIHKQTKGHSMPSRHIFSCTVIAMCALDIDIRFGALLLLVSVVFAVIRVIGGVHYPRDVAAGFAVGVLAGCILLAL